MNSQTADANFARIRKQKIIEMSNKAFFPARPNTNPTIYAYELVGVDTHKGLLKIGYTDRDAKTRIKEQLGTAAIQYKIVFEDSAMKRDGSSFTDHEVHRLLREWKVEIGRAHV